VRRRWQSRAPGGLRAGGLGLLHAGLRGLVLGAGRVQRCLADEALGAQVAVAFGGHAGIARFGLGLRSGRRRALQPGLGVAVVDARDGDLAGLRRGRPP
jgi:hypothetical protein